MGISFVKQYMRYKDKRMKNLHFEHQQIAREPHFEERVHRFRRLRDNVLCLDGANIGDRWLALQDEIKELAFVLKQQGEDPYSYATYHIMNGSTPPPSCTKFDFSGEIAIESFMRTKINDINSSKSGG